MKKGTSYKRELAVKANTHTVFHALTKEIGQWWTSPDKEISAVHDTATFRFDLTYWTMCVTQYVPDQLIEMECIEANHEEKNLSDTARSEWLGTKLIWRLEQLQDHTKITFVHEGLVPQLECYDMCEAGWDYFFLSSLKNYLETGIGHPG